MRMCEDAVVNLFLPRSIPLKTPTGRRDQNQLGRSIHDVAKFLYSYPSHSDDYTTLSTG